MNIDDSRYEIKFNANVSQYHNITTNILLNKFNFKISYPSRYVNNIYFDSIDLDAYKENLTGASSRNKVRLRWYNNLYNKDTATLEVKIKRNKLGWKKTKDIFFKSNIDKLSIQDLYDQVISSSNSYFKQLLNSYSLASIFNSYKRDYYESDDGKVRLTVDTDLKSFNLLNENIFNLRHKLIMPEICILEFKSKYNEYDKLQKVIQDFNFIRTRNSKYVIAVSSMLNR